MSPNSDDFWELREALEIGLDCDPSPITAADFCELLRAQGDDLHVGDIYRALESLVKDNFIESDFMYDAKRQCTVKHYFGKHWDGMKLSQPQHGESSK